MAFGFSDQDRLKRQEDVVAGLQQDRTASPAFVSAATAERDRLRTSVAGDAAATARDQAAFRSTQPPATTSRYELGQGLTGPLAARPTGLAGLAAPLQPLGAARPQMPANWSAGSRARPVPQRPVAAVAAPTGLPPTSPLGPQASPAQPRAAASAAVPGLPFSPRPRPIVIDGSPNSPTNPYLRPAGATPGASAAAAQPAPAPAGPPVPADGVYRGRSAAGNSVYSDSAAGLERATALANGQRPPPLVVPGATITPGTAPAAPAGTSFNLSGNDAQPFAARPVAQVPTSAPTPGYQARGRQGGIIRNPDQGSLANRIAQAMGDSRLAGSPSGRRAVADALMAEAGYANAERQSALATGDAADLDQIRNQAIATEGSARRTADAQQFNADLQDRAADRGARLQEARLARRPTPITTADGTMGLADDSGSFRPITGADGQPVRAAMQPRQTGELTEGDKLKSYTDRLNAINSGLGSPDEKKAQLDALNADPIYASLRSAAPAQVPTFEAFLAEARSKNSKMSDAQLRQAYDERVQR